MLQRDGHHLETQGPVVAQGSFLALAEKSRWRQWRHWLRLEMWKMPQRLGEVIEDGVLGVFEMGVAHDYGTG